MPTELLTPQVRDIVTNLVTGLRRPPPWCPSTEEQELLTGALEQILADAGAFDDYLRFLRNLLGANPPPYQLVEGEEEEAVLAHGLARLPAERIRQLAIDPVGLHGLHDAIVEAMPDYWWTLIHERGRRSGRVKPKEAVFEELFGKPFHQEPASPWSALVGAFQTGEEPVKVGDAERWSVKHGDTTIEFSLLQTPTCVLEVRLFGGLNLAPSVRCMATLSREEQVVVQGVKQVGRLTFALSSPVVTGLTLNVEHHKGDKQTTFSVAVKE